MSEVAPSETKRVTLAEFLGRLGEDDAGKAKAASDAIDELEERARRVRGIERRLEPYFYIALLAFVIGLARIIGGEGFMFGLLGWIDGLGISLLLGGLPVLGFYYAFRVRWRTRADSRAFELNQQFFLPHGAIYFPAGEPGEAPSVVLIDKEKGWKPRPSKYDNVKPGWMW